MKAPLLAALLMLLACAQPQAQTQPTPPASVFPPDTGAIFAGDDARKLINQCSRPAPAPVVGVWTPTQAAVAALEPGLGPLIDQRLRADGWTAPGQDSIAPQYYRQYAGLIIDGRRVIYVNGFNAASLPQSSSTDGPPFDWRHQAMDICDGGPVTFGVEYDPASHAFAHFAFNGALRPPPGADAARACDGPALNAFTRRHLDGSVVMLPVNEGREAAALGANVPIPPLSTVKLLLYAIYLKHEPPLRGLPLDPHELIARGVDDVGRHLALDLRHRLGSHTMLNDLASFGFPACGPDHQMSCTQLTPTTPDTEWADALSLGENNMSATANSIASFLRDIASDRTLTHDKTLRFEAALRDTVETGTATSIRDSLGRLGSIGGKTGSGPASVRPLNGIFAGLVFDAHDAPRFAFATYVRGGGNGGTNAAAISADLARAALSGACAQPSPASVR